MFDPFDELFADRPSHPEKPKLDAEDYHRHIQALRSQEQYFLQPLGSDLLRLSDDTLANYLYSDITNGYRSAEKEVDAALHKLVAECLAVPRIQELSEVQQFFSQTNPVASAVQALREGKITPATLRAILIAHIERFQEKTQEFNEAVEQMKGRLRTRLHALIEDPSHPLTADMLPPHRIEERFADIEVRMADAFILARSDGSIGKYNMKTRRVVLPFDNSAEEGLEQFEETFIHEMLHGLSGRGAIKDGKNYIEVKSGFGLKRKGRYGYMHRLLVEAVTETLTQDVQLGERSYTHGKQYLAARDIYKKMLRKIPEELFLAAYFEDSNDQKPEAYRLLEQAIDREYGEGFFVQLDYYLEWNSPKEINTRFDEEGNYLAA